MRVVGRARAETDGQLRGADVMERLLDFSTPLDVALLEQVVATLYQGAAPDQIQMAQRILSQLQERISGEEASSALNWFRVDMILDPASSTCTSNTKFYALQVSARSPAGLATPAAACHATEHLSASPHKTQA